MNTAPSEIVELFRDNEILVGEDEMLFTWFGHMRAIRDDISHNGQRPVVFGTPDDGILFQVVKKNVKYVIPSVFTHIYFQ